MREFYSDLSDVKHNDPNLVNAVKLAKRCHEKYVNEDFDVQKAWESLQIDTKREFKSLFVTNSLDGSEDYLLSGKLFSLIGEEMKTSRKELMSSNSSRTLKEVVRNLIPHKGVVRKSNVEGSELMDGEGDEISVEEQQQEYEQVPDEEESNVIEAV